VNCHTPINHLEDYLDGVLDTALHKDVEKHLSQCPSCNSWIEREIRLRKAIKNLPITPPDVNFVDRVFKHAIAQDNRPFIDYSRWIKLAASIILIFTFSFGVKEIWDARSHDIVEISVAVNQEEEIKLVFNSNENLDDVTFSILLSEGVELSGFVNQREIIWKGELEQGQNQLTLPVIVYNQKGGHLIAKITHDNGSKQFDLKIHVKESSYTDDLSKSYNDNGILPGLV
jgi:hypothetical protein